MSAGRTDGLAYIDDDAEREDDRHPAQDVDSLATVVPAFQRLHVQVISVAEPTRQAEATSSLVGEAEGSHDDDDGEDYMDWDQDDEFEIENEDWEVVDSDFTKQYNRMRQHQKAIAGGGAAAAVPLPARNARRQRTSSTAILAASRPANQTPADGLAHRRTLAPAPRYALPGVSSAPKAAYTKANAKDKADRATQEQVLDPRTKAVLASLVRKGLVEDVGGCVSTGKEANVYHGASPAVAPISSNASAPYPSPYPASIALKVYKTSILSFKSRSAYMVGEHRLKNAYTAVSNPRKMVRTWAEKELRNLRRLDAGGVACPKVVEVRENVLVMEFLGDVDGKPSPRLKDADISSSRLADLYADLMIAMRWMYHRCKIVHADLSEYNILFHNKSLYIIDVSQSVEHDHPASFDFLRKDIQNMNDYFIKRSGGAVRTLGIKGAFDFIVNVQLRGSATANVDEESEDGLREVLRKWLDEGVGLDAEIAEPPSMGAAAEPTGDATSTGPLASKLPVRLNDNEFMSAYIPRSLAEVYDPERDTAKLKAGDSDLIYAGVTGLNAIPAKPQEVTNDAEAGSTTAEPQRTVRFANEEDTSGSEAESSDGDATTERRPRGFRHEDRDAKKERKKALKEENREKRKTKMPKADKAKLTKKGSHRK